jgi:hypothetical protein
MAQSVQSTSGQPSTPDASILISPTSIIAAHDDSTESSKLNLQANSSPRAKSRQIRLLERAALRRVFEGVVAKCIAAGLVGGGGIFIDASLIKAAVDKKKRVPGDQPIAWPNAEEAARALAQLPERKVGPCVTTVSIVCGPTGRLQGWAREGRRLSSQP